MTEFENLRRTRWKRIEEDATPMLSFRGQWYWSVERLAVSSGRPAGAGDDTKTKTKKDDPNWLWFRRVGKAN